MNSICKGYAEMNFSVKHDAIMFLKFCLESGNASQVARIVEEGCIECLIDGLATDSPDTVAEAVDSLLYTINSLKSSGNTGNLIIRLRKIDAASVVEDLIGGNEKMSALFAEITEMMSEC